VLGVWEFDTRLRLGRFRPHHGFVFGSATAMLAWLAHAAPARDLADVGRSALVIGSLLGFWNVLYDVKALQAGILRVYNQPWAEGKGTAEIVLDYGPWFFGGFGAIYGGGMAVLELLDFRGLLTMPLFVAVLSVLLGLALLVPTAGYVGQSIVRHGHWGTRPVMKQKSQKAGTNVAQTLLSVPGAEAAAAERLQDQVLESRTLHDRRIIKCQSV
jgi:hypothetical protein